MTEKKGAIDQEKPISLPNRAQAKEEEKIPEKNQKVKISIKHRIKMSGKGQLIE